MSANTATDATTLVMDSAPGFTSLLEAAGSQAVARWGNAWSNADFDNQVTAATFDNRPTWDNPNPVFDNRPTWDNWKNK
ncbi:MULTISPECIES: multiple cyclophane-containing RiPP AmcA [unclassified Streptomyces]|uniref:multiple cyclophane-containing RiPP AmcA n=1 Tax=unclassified Streptomyces TaxID=2593676 RepID=UPI0034308105